MQCMVDPVSVANSVRESVESWIDEMGNGLSPGRFRFCKTRSLVPTRGKRGQVTTCFAAKSAWHIGAWEDWPSETREGCTRFIKSFQEPNGNFVDRWLLNSIGWSSRIVLAKQGRFREVFSDFQNEKVRAVRAETRQSAATLMLWGDGPKHPLPLIWQDEASVREFVRSMGLDAALGCRESHKSPCGVSCHEQWGERVSGVELHVVGGGFWKKATGIWMMLRARGQRETFHMCRE